MGCRPPSRRARERAAARSGSLRQKTSTAPANSATARSRRAPRHQPSATASGKSAASRNTTSPAASPTRFDQSSSPSPSTSASASLIGSSDSTGNPRAAPSSRAMVDFPVPGAPETTMRLKPQPQRAAISYGLGCLVSHCQNVRYGGRAMKWPLPTLPETSIRSTSGPS